MKKCVMNTRFPALLVGIALAAFAITYRHALESTMARHMLVQIPMLLAAGACASFSLRKLETASHLKISSIAKHLCQYDENGITGLFFFIFVTAYWMIPKALDSAALSMETDLCKFLSLLLAGLLLPGSLSRANTVIQLFFIVNFAAMSAIVGMLFQDTPRRLCNLYLIDDQMITGTGLVTLSIALPVLWLMLRMRTDSNTRIRMKITATSHPAGPSEKS